MKFTWAAGVLACGATLSPLYAGEHHPAQTGSAQSALTALADGNHRFTSGHSKHPHMDRSRIRDTGAHGQHPQAVILTCADSRVSPELLFDQGIGDLFTIRVAGNVANEDEVASVEYAADHLGVPLCVVLGHTGCGAVTAVVKHDKLPASYDHLLSPIRATVREHHRKRPGLTGETLIAEAVRANVWHATADLLQHDETLRKKARTGKLAVVGAVYDTHTGTVRWLGHHPNEKALLKAGK
jgi:carbonic anhydrase